MKIKQKLILGFISVAMMVTIAGYLSVSASQKALQEKIGESSVVLAVQVMGDIDRQIYTRIETFQEYCRDLITQRVVSKSNKEFEKLDDIQAYIDRQDRQWVLAAKEETTAFMEELINNELSDELREKIEFYDEKYDYEVFVEVIMTNKYGANVAQTQITTDYYHADKKWWQQAKINGLYVGNFGYDESADIYSTDICIRLDDEAGNFIGVTKVVLNIKDSINLINNNEKGSLEFKLLTKDGKVIYGTEEFGFIDSITDEKSVFDFLQKQQHDHQSYFIAEDDKSGRGEKLLAYVHSKGHKEYEGLGWILVVEYETEEIFASVTRLRNSILIISLAITVVAIALGFFISRLISVPIAKLTIAAAKIGKGDLETRVKIDSNDETGQLANSFNKMAEGLQTTTTSIKKLNTVNKNLQANEQQLKASNQQLQVEISEREKREEELCEVHKELVSASHRAGMAEVATDVLHNVGNVLNSINVSIAMMGETLSDSKISNFKKITDIIEDHVQDLPSFLAEDPKGKHIPSYLIKVANLLTGEQAEVVEELQTLTKNVEHIKEIVKMQQSYSKAVGVEVEFSLTELVNNAIQINIAGMERHGVDLKTEFAELPEVNIDKQRVLQILVNLINNAKYAVSKNNKKEKTLIIRFFKQNEDRLCIEVADNGIGISQENKSKIFRRGFTTKKDGHGFGLHSGALAAKEMGGSLTVHSKGLGQGAVFILELPFKPVGIMR